MRSGRATWRAREDCQYLTLAHTVADVGVQLDQAQAGDFRSDDGFLPGRDAAIRSKNGDIRGHPFAPLIFVIFLTRAHLAIECSHETWLSGYVVELSNL